jgi:ABC-type transport system involved in multi-copper enzyme maturation permease subunit
LDRLKIKKYLFKLFKPVFQTFKFELYVQRIKFIIFSVVSFIVAFISGFINRVLPWPQYSFYQSSLWWFVFTILFSSSFFFSSIICSEYKKKTGLMIIPLITRQELFVGKFLANYLYVVVFAAIHYIIMYILAFELYGPPLISTPLISFAFVTLFILALCCLISFFSSFMPSPAYVIIIIMALYVFGFSMIQSIIDSSIEPLYSFSYLYKIIIVINNPDFSVLDRISEIDGTIYWDFPTVEGAILSLSVYVIIFFSLTLFIFKKKQI